MNLKELGIDYPQPRETVAAGPYSFRVTAPLDAREVKISVNDGPWRSCRQTDGYWWFDAYNEAAGDHVAVSRVIHADGTVAVSQPRLYSVLAN
jgi:hypothetical protein